jgi:hypothetical protein
MDVVPDAPEHDVGEPATFVEEVAAPCAELDTVGNEPRPTVPRLVVPRPSARPDCPCRGQRPAVGDVALAAVVELGEFITPELLTELHGTGALVLPERRVGRRRRSRSRD